VSSQIKPLINDQGLDHSLVIPIWIHVERIWIEPVNDRHRRATISVRKK